MVLVIFGESKHILRGGVGGEGLLPSPNPHGWLHVCVLSLRALGIVKPDVAVVRNPPPQPFCLSNSQTPR